MKKIIFIIYLLGFVSVSIFAQPLTDQQRQRLITSLDSSDYGIKMDAISRVTEENIKEAIPEIEQGLWKQDPYMQYLFLRALWKLNAPSAHSFANAFYDSATTFKNHIWHSEDPLKMKVRAVEILFAFRDYSKASVVLDLLNRDSVKVDVVARRLLRSIIENVPEYAAAAKDYLIRIAENAEDSDDRWYSFIDLASLYGSGASNVLINVARNDKKPVNRYYSLFLLCRINKSLGHTLLLERLRSEPESPYHVVFTDTLLLRYGETIDYKTVEECQQLEADTTAKSLMWFSLHDFIPPKPDSTIALIQVIDSIETCLSHVKSYNWIGDQSFTTELNGYLAIARNNINAHNLIGCTQQVRAFQLAVDKEFKDSTNITPAFITVEGWKFLHYNAQYILDRLPQIPSEPGWNVKIVSSNSIKLTGGTLQYYEGNWKDAVNNNDGTFAITSTAKTLSLRMTYEYGTQTKSNVSISSDTIVFQTVNAQVQLQNSSGASIDTGTVQYYAGAWRTIGMTNNGTINKELLPGNYSFRMSYAYASKDKQQDIGTNPTVVFQTVNATVQLQNSQGALMDQGTVMYYSGAWREFGATVNGTTNKELLPNNYSFRMSYAYASKDKQQDIGTNATVVFQTVNADVQLKNSLGNLIDQGTVQYYSGAWRSLGTTSNGVASKELLPNNYSFRMTYEYVSIDKSQDLSVNNIVGFSTVLCTIRVQNTQAQPVNGAIASYYSGAWRQLGNTVNGEVTKELLPVNLTFRVKYGTQQKDEQQNLSTNNVVHFVVQ